MSSHFESAVEPPARVLLCLDPGCHEEFYLPLDLDDAMVCPNVREHPVAVYSAPTLHRGDLEPWGPDHPSYDEMGQ